MGAANLDAASQESARGMLFAETITRTRISADGHSPVRRDSRHRYIGLFDSLDSSDDERRDNRTPAPARASPSSSIG
ncbi:hypothetical protein EVAR_44552_1 [Eumeta japonica]|uniref:Uncharacterized protein n=1 Tax=Eumeta variegata TaxID=151549 RepID=A0A4C1X7V1_EUMVA|nr:hypothetical protein EVAR_44552_1 [Eumeta japonica]